jgi:hypothetical protein
MVKTPFELAILKMKDLGIFQFFLPFMLSSAIFYGLLRKSQIFGKPEDNISVNAIVALVASFMVWAYPILVGVDIQTQLATFFMQGISAMLVILVGLLITSMFLPPNLADQFGKIFGLTTGKPGRIWTIIIIAAVMIGGAILLTSGLINVFFPAGTGGIGGLSLSTDTVITLGILILLGITVAVIAFTGREEKK